MTNPKSNGVEAAAAAAAAAVEPEDVVADCEAWRPQEKAQMVEDLTELARYRKRYKEFKALIFESIIYVSVTLVMFLFGSLIHRKHPIIAQGIWECSAFFIVAAIITFHHLKRDFGWRPPQTGKPSPVDLRR